MRGPKVVHACVCVTGWGIMQEELRGGSDESLSVDDAADIWMCSGMDEDYTFGYDEKSLREALKK